MTTRPPASWFDNPGLKEPTALTVKPGGRIFGHAWLWGTCHTGKPGRCVTPPHSKSGYAYFHLGQAECVGRKTRDVGQITLATGHAPMTARAFDTIEHYDHTGTAVADVTLGEDEHGGWFAGALRPDLPASRVRELRAAKLSGDWRDVGGALELVGLLAVNVPGFPVPRARRSAAALVAAGIPGQDTSPRSDIAHDRRVRALVASIQAPRDIDLLCARIRTERPTVSELMARISG